MLNTFERNLEILDGLETDYVRILYYDLPRNYSGVYKTYNCFRFCTIFEGQKRVSLDNDEKFTYDKNNYLLLPPESKVNMDIDVRTKALVFELSDRLIDKVLNKTQFVNDGNNALDFRNSHFLGENKFDISKDISDIFQASLNNESNNEFLIDFVCPKIGV